MRPGLFVQILPAEEMDDPHMFDEHTINNILGKFGYIDVCEEGEGIYRIDVEGVDNCWWESRYFRIIDSNYKPIDFNIVEECEYCEDDQNVTLHYLNCPSCNTVILPCRFCDDYLVNRGDATCDKCPFVTGCSIKYVPGELVKINNPDVLKVVVREKGNIENSFFVEAQINSVILLKGVSLVFLDKDITKINNNTFFNL